MAKNKTKQPTARARVRVSSYPSFDDDYFRLNVKAARRTSHVDPRWNNQPATTWLSFVRRGVEVTAFLSVQQLKALRTEIDAAIAVAEDTPVACQPDTCGYCKTYPEKVPTAT